MCLGNICRSPLAEGLFNQLTKKHKVSHLFDADSAGTSNFHKGEKPDARTIENARNHDLELRHFARQFNSQDFVTFDHILVMDQQNYLDVMEQTHDESNKLKVKLLREYDSHLPGADVPDPWFGGDEGFEEVYEIIHRSVLGFFEELTKKK